MFFIKIQIDKRFNKINDNFIRGIVMRNIKLFFLIFFLFNFKNDAQSLKNEFVVVVDAGHGGKDPGNRGNGYFEKNIALKIALNVGQTLSKNGVNVVYTRKKDVFVDLFRRAQIANEANADLFISIHCDAHNSNAYGAGTFVLGLHANERNFKIAQKENSVIYMEENYEQKYDGFDPNNPESVISLVLMQEEYLEQSIVAANYIQEFFVNDLNRKDRKVKQAGFLVLRNTYMPSVLIEAGFLTNKTEGKYLNSTKGQNEISSSVSKAVLKYLRTLDNNRVELNNDKKPLIRETRYLFKIQISASSKLLELKPYNFKGLSSITRTKTDSGLYKYYYGYTSSYNQAKILLKTAQNAGFKSSFVTVFKDGEPYSLKKYLDEFE
jgi:N-acetylmuramoyl-L-alanine amidase